MAYRQSKIASVSDTGDAAKVQPSDLNFESVPASPAEGDFRIERTGTSPTRYIRYMTYDNGAWRITNEYVY